MLKLKQFKNKLLFWKKEEIPISSEIDQNLRQKRFGFRIDPMMEKEFYDYLEFEKRVNRKYDRYNVKIKEVMELINKTKSTDFKIFQEFLQVRLFYY